MSCAFGNETQATNELQAVTSSNSSRLQSNYTVHHSIGPSSTYRSPSISLHESSSSTVFATSTVGLGDYIASGLGLGLAEPTLQTASSTSNTSSASVSGEESCWTQWGVYWESAASLTETSWSELTTITSNTYYWTTYPPSTTRLQLVTDVENGRPWRTRTFTNTRTVDFVIEPVSTYATSVEQWSDVPAYPDLATPSCELPTSMPRCQSQWDDWVLHQTASVATFNETKSCDWFATDTACVAQASSRASYYSSWYSAASAPSPGCTQASVGGSACDALISTYTSRQGLQSSMTISGYTWPASKSMAAGCTVGCQSCRITGGQVELM